MGSNPSSLPTVGRRVPAGTARAARAQNKMSAKIPGGKPTDDAKKKPAERRRNRTNYRCSKCGQPKRGHVCPYQPRVVKDPTAPAVPTRNAAVQVEMDERLAVRHLSLAAQGLPESYGEIPPPPPPGAPPNYSPGGSGASPDLSFSGDLSLGSAGALRCRPGEVPCVIGFYAARCVRHVLPSPRRESRTARHGYPPTDAGSALGAAGSATTRGVGTEHAVLRGSASRS